MSKYSPEYFVPKTILRFMLPQDEPINILLSIYPNNGESQGEVKGKFRESAEYENGVHIGSRIQ